MIGAIIGDIVGSLYEFNNTFDYNTELFKPGSTFTDDTICTIAIADALVKKISYKDSLIAWCQQYPNPKGGYGARFSSWINSEDHDPYNSYGNGSAMRVSPVAWWYDDIFRVIQEAEATAKVSHDHLEGIRGAVAVASSISWLRNNRSCPDLEFATRLKCYYPHYNKMPQKGIFDESCQFTVPLCMDIVCNSQNFEDAIRKALSYGGDSDTICAIVGSMAEARFGIPKQMISSAYDILPSEMISVINRFNEQLKNNYHG